MRIFRKPPLYAFLAVLIGLGLYRAADSAIQDWSTTAGSNNAAVPNGFPENQTAGSMNDSMRETLAQIRRWAEQQVLSTFGPDGGTVNAGYISPAILPSATFVSGARITYIPANTNSSATPTLKIGSIGPLTIARISAASLAVGDLQKGTPADLIYQGTQGGLILLNPQRPIAISVHKGGTTQNISSAAATKVTFGTEVFDFGSYFTGSAWTPPPGVYQFNANLTFSTANLVDQQNILVLLYKNGVLAASSNAQTSGAAQQPSVHLSYLIDATGYDVFEIYAVKNGAGDGTIDGTASATYFTGFRVTP